MNKLKEDFLRYVAQTSPYPLGFQVQKAEGSYFINAEGDRYLDFTSGIAVNNLGHGLPEIVRAIKQQADSSIHTMVFGEFVVSPQVSYAKQLCESLPPNLNCLYYCTSGSEAIEASMKLAKRKTGRAEIISFHGAYHGSTHGALSIMGSEQFKTAYRPLLPATKQLQFNSFEDIEQITSQTACVIVEPIQAASGVTCAEKDWLKALRNKSTDVGAMLIFDEIQTGFGRTGTLFAFQQYNVIPDALLLAKAMGGGVPIGGLVTDRQWMKLFSQNPILGHINTFGGNSIACAAAKANLNYLQNHPEIIETVNEKAEKIIMSLQDHEQLTKITHSGLLMALHLKSANKAQQLILKALEQKIVLLGFILNDKTVRLAPPLNISEEDLEVGINGLLQALDQI